jgi:hypothetical protein
MEGSGQLHALGCLTSRDGALHQYPMNMTLIGSSGGLDTLEKTENSRPCHKLNRCPAFSLVTTITILYQPLYLFRVISKIKLKSQLTLIWNWYLTCEHTLINDTISCQQNSITMHHTAMWGNHHHIPWDQVLSLYCVQLPCVTTYNCDHIWGMYSAAQVLLVLEHSTMSSEKWGSTYHINSVLSQNRTKVDCLSKINLAQPAHT